MISFTVGIESPTRKMSETMAEKPKLCVHLCTLTQEDWDHVEEIIVCRDLIARLNTDPGCERIVYPDCRHGLGKRSHNAVSGNSKDTTEQGVKKEKKADIKQRISPQQEATEYPDVENKHPRSLRPHSARVKRRPRRPYDWNDFLYGEHTSDFSADFSGKIKSLDKNIPAELIYPPSEEITQEPDNRNRSTGKASTHLITETSFKHASQRDERKKLCSGVIRNKTEDVDISKISGHELCSGNSQMSTDKQEQSERKAVVSLKFNSADIGNNVSDRAKHQRKNVNTQPVLLNSNNTDRQPESFKILTRNNSGSKSLRAVVKSTDTDSQLESPAIEKPKDKSLSQIMTRRNTDIQSANPQVLTRKNSDVKSTSVEGMKNRISKSAWPQVVTRKNNEAKSASPQVMTRKSSEAKSANLQVVTRKNNAVELDSLHIDYVKSPEMQSDSPQVVTRNKVIQPSTCTGSQNTKSNSSQVVKSQGNDTLPNKAEITKSKNIDILSDSSRIVTQNNIDPCAKSAGSQIVTSKNIDTYSYTNSQSVRRKMDHPHMLEEQLLAQSESTQTMRNVQSPNYPKSPATASLTEEKITSGFSGAIPIPQNIPSCQKQSKSAETINTSLSSHNKSSSPVHQSLSECTNSPFSYIELPDGVEIVSFPSGTNNITEGQLLSQGRIAEAIYDDTDDSYVYYIKISSNSKQKKKKKIGEKDQSKHSSPVSQKSNSLSDDVNKTSPHTEKVLAVQEKVVHTKEASTLHKMKTPDPEPSKSSMCQDESEILPDSDSPVAEELGCLADTNSNNSEYILSKHGLSRKQNNQKHSVTVTESHTEMQRTLNESCTVKHCSVVLEDVLDLKRKPSQESQPPERDIILSPPNKYIRFSPEGELMLWPSILKRVEDLVTSKHQRHVFLEVDNTEGIHPHKNLKLLVYKSVMGPNGITFVPVEEDPMMSQLVNDKDNRHGLNTNSMAINDNQDTTSSQHDNEETSQADVPQSSSASESNISDKSLPSCENLLNKPIISWTTQDVADLFKKHGLDWLIPHFANADGRIVLELMHCYAEDSEVTRTYFKSIGCSLSDFLWLGAILRSLCEQALLLPSSENKRITNFKWSSLD